MKSIFAFIFLLVACQAKRDESGVTVIPDPALTTPVRFDLEPQKTNQRLAYKVISSDNLEDFNQRVSMAIEQGLKTYLKFIRVHIKPLIFTFYNKYDKVIISFFDNSFDAN